MAILLQLTISKSMLPLLLTLMRLGLPTQAPLQPRLAQPLQELIRTEVVYPQERHETQVTVIAAVDRHRDGDALSFPLHLEYGLSNKWQTEVEWVPYARERTDDGSAQGVGDFGFGTKYSLMRMGGSNLHTAFGVDIERALEREVDGTVLNAWTAAPFLSAAFDFPPRVQIFGQTGVTLALHNGHAVTTAASDTPSEAGAFVNAGALVALRHVTLATEINWVPGSDGRAIYLTPSVTAHLRECCELGVGVSAGLNSAADRYSVVVQFIVEK